MNTLSRYLPYFLLLLLSLALFVPGQASLPPLDRDESRYTQATAQMFETGNFFDIRFQDQPRYLQPAGIYWLQAASVSLLSAPADRDVWAYRVPSLIGATLAVLLTAWIGNLLFGAPVGFLAAVLIAVSLILGVEARMAKIDAVLLSAVLGAQAALAKIYLESTADGEPSLGWVAAFWLALGAGLMLKGPIILLVVFGTTLMLTITERRAAWLWRLQPLRGVPLLLLIVLPWFIAIAVASKGEFFATAVGHNLLGKVATGQQSHGAPPGYYLVAFALTFWPGSLFAAVAVPFAWAMRRDPAVRFCLCWIIPTWIVFELILTKLPHYVLPIYPAIACLAAAGLLRPDRRDTSRWAAALMRTFAALWLVVGIALACWLPVAIWLIDARVDLTGVLAAFSVVSLLIGTLLLLKHGRAIRAVAMAGTAALVLFATAYAYQLPHLQAIWMSPRIAEAVARARPCVRTIVATAPYVEPSLVFLLGTGTELTDIQGVAEHLRRDPVCGLALVGADERSSFLSLLDAARLVPRELDHIRGINYSSGKWLELTLYAVSPAG